MKGKVETHCSNGAEANEELQMTRVFLSHSTEDREFVEKEIIPIIQNHNIETWYSPLSINTGEEWEPSIRKGLEGCDWFLVVMSPRSAKSEWVKTEVFWAINKRKERIIPILHETCDPTDFHLMLSQLQHIDFRRNLEEAKKKLIDRFGKGEKGQQPRQITSPSTSVDPLPLFGLGTAYYQKEDYDSAINEFTSAIELCPDYTPAYIMRGVAQNSKKEYDKAIADLTTAINLKPNNWLASLAYSKRGNCYARKEEYQKAIADCSEAIELDSKNASAYLDRGAIYTFSYQNEKALADFNQAIHLDPNYTQAYINRAGIYRMLGQLDKAKSDYSKALQLDPSVAKKIPEHLNKADDNRAARIEEALKSIQALGGLANLNNLPPENKKQAINTVAGIGWERIAGDLEFLKRNFPKGHPYHDLAEKMAQCVPKEVRR